MSKRILYLVGAYPSVTETFIENEIAALQALGLSIDVVSVSHSPTASSLQSILSVLESLLLAPRLLELRHVQVSAKRALGASLRAPRFLEAARRAEHIHAHFLGLPATLAFCLSQRTGLPYSLTAHARDIYAVYTPEIVVRRAAFRTTCTATNKSYLDAKWPDSPFHLIRHGVKIPAAKECRTDEGSGICRLLAIGRLVEKKGFRFLVDACRILEANHVPFRLTLIGDGPERPQILRQIDFHMLHDRVMLKDFMPHPGVIDAMQDSDILVVPSLEAQDGDREGIPNVILEAMACGLNVIASDSGSISEAIRDRHTGILVPARDPEALAAAVGSLRQNTELRAELRSAAMQLCKDEFRQEQWAQRLYRLFSA